MQNKNILLKKAHDIHIMILQFMFYFLQISQFNITRII